MRMQTTVITFVLILATAAGIVAFSASPEAAASSLWNSSGSMYADNKARAVGDLVTLIIVERAQATQSAQTQTGSDGKVQVGPISLADIVPVIPPISAGGSDSAAARGSTTRGGTINARMTAKVVEVLPNGNLVIEGRQTIIVNKEEQVIVVSGQVRPKDVAPDNTVLSTFVADATIRYEGTGPIGEKQNPGLLTRIFNWLF